MTASPRLARIPFYQLVATSVDLASAFKSAVDAFNGRDLIRLLSLCDDNVVVVGIKRHDHYCGKEAVAAYLEEQFRVSKPIFTPTTSDTTINPGGTVGHIIGTADWTDYDPQAPQGARVEGVIRYAFNFINPTNEWRISTVWGSPDYLDYRS